MPELPEVESIRLHLTKYLIGHKVIKIEVNFRKTLEEGEGKLINGKIINVGRFGKVLSIDLSNGYSALIHLKMTGQLIYRGPNLKTPPGLSNKVVGGIPGKHTHVVFNLDRNGKLYFNDYRRFGWIQVIQSSKIKNQKFIQKLGPEPLKDLTFDKFSTVVQSTVRPIKLLLLDQEKMAGIGNIYANDALYLAGIDPRRKANTLSETEQKRLYKSVIKVLKDGLRYSGASQDAYVTAEGGEGSYQNHFLIYDRKGEKCKKPACRRAGAKIEKIKLGGRGTYYCERCQK